jgi:FkbM family methyltransferase
MLGLINRLSDLVRCSVALGPNPKARWRLFWKQTANLRVRLKLASYHPEQVYSLDTVYGTLHFRDNFGDVTNLVKLFWQGEYRLRQLQTDGVILDIGANIGLVAAWFAHFNPGRPIHCFEPLAANGAMVRRNCPSAQLHQVAVGRTRGRMTLRVDPQQIMASSVPTRWETSAVEFDVVPLDEFTRMQGIEQVALIKLDAEGMEVEILEGAPGTLARTQEIAMETHGRERHEAVIEILKRYGFSIVDQSFSAATGLVFASRNRQREQESVLAAGSRYSKS